MHASSAAVLWAHPGTFMSPKMTYTLKTDSIIDPIRSQALTKLIKETPLTYKPQHLATVDIDYGGVGVGHKECTKDGEMAVSAAILYWATGTAAYADLSLSILKGWSEKNIAWKGNNGLLEASWSVCSMARAAELLKYANDKVIADKWRAIEPQFLKWLDKVILPVIKSEHIWTWPLIGNWHFSQISARMQIAILREDVNEFDWCVRKFPEAVNKALLAIPVGHKESAPAKPKCKGQNSETCRDVSHSQFLLGGLIQVPEMALHQGVKLYDDRLFDAFELQARIMMKEVPDGLAPADIKTPYGYWYEPVWHIAHAHFTGRCKRPMPNTEKYIKQIGPDRVCFHWGPNCLTHYKRT